MSAYQVLARKWRPKTFADLVGQQHVVKALRNALDKGRLHHAYLLTGTRGVGKTTIARILAKSLNCENAHQGEPCGQCQSCQDIDAGRFVDLLEIDAASNTGIDNIREVLENAQYAPTSGKYKVYIIDEVHMLSKSAFNAMLKTLEEPPEHVKFILATTDPHKVPITVLSRCLQFVLRNMTAQQVADHLAYVLDSEQIDYEPNALALIGRAANGSMRDALSLLDQAIAMTSGSVTETDVRHMIGAVDKRYLFDLMYALSQKDSSKLIQIAQEMANNAIGFDNALNELAILWQRLALIKMVPNAIAQDDPEHEQLTQLTQYFHNEQIQLYYQCVIHGKKDLAFAPDEYAGFVMTLLRMLAFAPFAAQELPENAQINHTQLTNPATLHSESSNNQQETETEAETQIETEEQAEEKSLGSVDANITLPENHATTDIISPNENQELPTWQTTETLPENPPIVENAPTLSGSIETGLNIETHQENSVSVDNTSDTTTNQQTSNLLPLNAENWIHIAQNIAPHIGAAHMLLSNLSWRDFQNNTLYLDLNEKYNIAFNKSHVQRIAKLLSEQYQQDITINIQTTENESEQETLNQHNQRIQQETRQKAQQLLEQDTAAQDLIRLFEGKWQENTLVLH
ncbi:MAG: DNA polymerase III subunit gamma/tau [Neisseriaceae bacterium]|nr:DNA polymerase III subunit gamma/tau [Neisseriaceae bacterium]